MDRTILQKYISGNRFPTSYACIEKIVSHLTLTDQQKYDLKKAYQIEELGLDQYRYLLKIKSIVENIHYIEPYHLQQNINLILINHVLQTWMTY